MCTRTASLFFLFFTFFFFLLSRSRSLSLSLSLLSFSLSHSLRSSFSTLPHISSLTQHTRTHATSPFAFWGKEGGLLPASDRRKVLQGRQLRRRGAHEAAAESPVHENSGARRSPQHCVRVKEEGRVEKGGGVRGGGVIWLWVQGERRERVGIERETERRVGRGVKVRNDACVAIKKSGLGA